MAKLTERVEDREAILDREVRCFSERPVEGELRT